MQQQQAPAEPSREQLEVLLIKANARIKELNKTRQEAQSQLDSLPKDQNAEISRINPNLPLADRDTRLMEIRNHYKTLTTEAQQAIVSATYT